MPARERRRLHRLPPPEETEVVDFAALYNLEPPPGAAARIGFHALSVTVAALAGVRPGGEHNAYAQLANAPQAEPFVLAETVIWGNPADPRHDAKRGNCASIAELTDCPLERRPQRAFLTLPSCCEGPLATRTAIDSWQDPGAFLAGGEPDLADPAWSVRTALAHDEFGPVDQSGCGVLAFAPDRRPPHRHAAPPPTGLDFSLDFDDNRA